MKWRLARREEGHNELHYYGLPTVWLKQPPLAKASEIGKDPLAGAIEAGSPDSETSGTRAVSGAFEVIRRV